MKNSYSNKEMSKNSKVSNSMNSDVDEKVKGGYCKAGSRVSDCGTNKAVNRASDCGYNKASNKK